VLKDILVGSDVKIRVGTVVVNAKHSLGFRPFGTFIESYKGKKAGSS
jgi:hypothetical protein